MTKPKRTIEPWQIIAVVAVLALVGVLAYVELSRDHAPAAAPAQASGPMTMPPMMQQPAVDIAALEAAVAGCTRRHEGCADAGQRPA